MSKSVSFEVLGLNKLILSTLDKLDYKTPSPIQEKAIPHVIAGKDVMAAAQTGTGKTAAFTLPILHRLADHRLADHRLADKQLADKQKAKQKGNQARVLILTPTRELAAQVADSVRQYSQQLRIKTAVVFGGVGINPQMQKLRGGVDVLIATPGRLLDLHNQNAVKFDHLEVLVLDEADRMLDMGFIHDIRRIIKLLPKRRQTLLFSATFSNEIKELANGIVYQPVQVSVSPPNSTVDSVKQSLIAVEKADKRKVLSQLIDDGDWYQVLVFSRTKHGANRLARQLSNSGIEAMAIHGDKSQGARTKALASFKSGDLRVLVATDIAARGLDIDLLPHVVNFDLPQVAEDYVHRIGRTGRAGATGEAISLVSHDEHSRLVDIERLIKKQIPRVSLDGYQPLNELPASNKTANQKRKTHKKKSAKKRPNRNSNAGKQQGRGAKSQQDGPTRRRRPSRSRNRNKAKSSGQNQ